MVGKFLVIEVGGGGGSDVEGQIRVAGRDKIEWVALVAVVEMEGGRWRA